VSYQWVPAVWTVAAFRKMCERRVFEMLNCIVLVVKWWPIYTHYSSIVFGQFLLILLFHKDAFNWPKVTLKTKWFLDKSSKSRVFLENNISKRLRQKTTFALHLITFCEMVVLSFLKTSVIWFHFYYVTKWHSY